MHTHLNSLPRRTTRRARSPHTGGNKCLLLIDRWMKSVARCSRSSACFCAAQSEKERRESDSTVAVSAAGVLETRAARKPAARGAKRRNTHVASVKLDEDVQVALQRVCGPLWRRQAVPHIPGGRRLCLPHPVLGLPRPPARHRARSPAAPARLVYPGGTACGRGHEGNLGRWHRWRAL